MAHQFDLIVIGEGVSGLTCASHATQAGLKVATIESILFGGLVLNVNELDGFPGQESGTDFASQLVSSNAEAGVTSIQEEVTGIRPAGAGFEVATGTGAKYGARQVVVASGAKLKKLGVPGEVEFEGRGVSHCADCDAPMYMNEEAIVVGGGDSAMQEALVLAKFCSKVQIVHRGGALRAKKHLADQVSANPKISIRLNSTIEAILGGQMVEKIRIRDANGKTEDVPSAGLFAYVGLEPNTGFAPKEISRDEKGCLATDAACETAMKGVWAIGAVRSGYSGLLRDATIEAKRVAEAVKKRLD